MKRNYGRIYAAPITAWLSAFFLIPLGIIVAYSFLTKGLYGGVVWKFSLDAYRALANPVLFKIGLTTLYIAVVSTVVMVALALPTAYFIARSRSRTTWLLLIIIPFWTNFLIRVYAWIAILGNNGFLNSLLVSIGLVRDHVQFLYNQNAVILVTVYTFLPFAILPLYTSIEKFDFSLLEAARDLGATKWESIFRVLLPNIRGGITTAILFTFIPAFGSYAIPQIVGGRDSLMLGNVIARELTVTRNWPLSSAISVVLTLVTTICVLIFVWSNKRSAGAAQRGKIPEPDTSPVPAPAARTASV